MVNEERIHRMKGVTRRIGMSLLMGLLFLIVGGTRAWAQSTAQISGTVTDPSGMVLPGVEVTVTQTDTGMTRRVVSNDTGSYVIPSLPVGPYRLDAALPGFRSYSQTEIVLTVGANPTINIALAVGQVSETVEVQANAPRVNTRSPGISQVMDNVRISELPLNGRQVTDLILLSGAVTAGAAGPQLVYPTANISVAGGLASGVAFQLDGGSHNDPLTNLNLPLPFPDALQEFKLETSGLAAQHGAHSAGTINAVTKSGTNRFHGNLFEFNRDDSRSARNAFASKQDTLKRNQYGGTLGGPIVRNRLFFFGAFQGSKLRTETPPALAYLPTPAMLAGDWTAITSPACNAGRQITLRAPFVNNRIDPALFSPVALNIVKLYAAPDNPCGERQTVYNVRINEDVPIAKVDYQVSAGHSLFGRYLLAEQVLLPHFDPANLLTTLGVEFGVYVATPVQQTWRTQSFVFGDTYAVGSNIVSSFRGTLLRTINERSHPPAGLPTPESVGMSGIYQPPEMVNRFANVRVGGGFTLGGSNGGPSYANATAFQFADDVSWVRGAHQIGFGGNYIHSRGSFSNFRTTQGLFTFTAGNTGLGLGDFMLGRPNNFTQRGPTLNAPHSNYASLYVQDTWQANSHFTFNGGIRWDPYLPMYWADGIMFHFDQEAFDQGIRSTVFTNAPAGALYSGDVGVPDSGKVLPNEWWNFSPRVGVAWDPAGDGRMAIRSSYGVFRDYVDMNKFSTVRTLPPWASDVVVQAPNFAAPWDAYPGGNPFPIPATPAPDIPFPTSASWVNVPLDLKSMYVHQWNLAIERQLAANWLVSASYLGSRIMNLTNAVEGNAAVFLPGASCILQGRTFTPCSSTANTNQRRRLSLQDPVNGQYYGSIVTVDDGGSMSYNGLLLTARHLAARGLTLQANYTWSHCINTGTREIFSVAEYTSDRTEANRATCGPQEVQGAREVDRRHNFNLSAVYAVPEFSNGTLRTLASGWQVSGIARVLSGSYVTVRSGLDNALTGNIYQTADQVLPSPYAPNKSIQQWLNPAAFAQPALGTYGNVGVRSIQGPGFVGIDMGLSRRFRILDGHSIEFRAEAFNLTNHVNPKNPVTILTDPNFGRILAAEDPRVLQFALKYAF